MTIPKKINVSIPQCEFTVASSLCRVAIDTPVAVFTEKVYLNTNSASSRIRICLISLKSHGNRKHVYMTNVNKIQGEKIYYDFKQRHFCCVISVAIILHLQQINNNELFIITKRAHGCIIVIIHC